MVAGVFPDKKKMNERFSPPPAKEGKKSIFVHALLGMYGRYSGDRPSCLARVFMKKSWILWIVKFRNAMRN
jgi:hypothetical protein